ncbi:hypothetical protein HN51_027039 [Arachis hypogaea]
MIASLLLTVFVILYGILQTRITLMMITGTIDSDFTPFYVNERGQRHTGIGLARDHESSMISFLKH